MNNPFTDTAVCWETRNQKHSRKATEWCKNYGLHGLTATLYIGKLKRKEREIIINGFQKLFIKKTEAFHIFPLCKSCYREIELYKVNKDQLIYPPFEIIG